MTNYKNPVVWQIAALHLDNKTLFTGVILHKVPYSLNKKPGSFRNLLKVISSYFVKSYDNKEISISVNGQTTNTTTDKDGSFRVLMDGLQYGEIKIHISNHTEALKITQDYPIIHENTNSPFDIISDIDDTIIVSHIKNFFKRVVTVAFKTPNEREVIGFSKKMFEVLKKRKARIFYVSKSESNLFWMLIEFIKFNKLPEGVLFLTPHLNLFQLLNPKKDINFKIDNIRLIIKNTADKKYVLFGDDGQLDIQIYSEIARSFPHRILKIYIRQTHSKISAHQKQMMDDLVSTGVPVKYFMSNDRLEISDELIQLKS